jgi:hypothetical protein
MISLLFAFPSNPGLFPEVATRLKDATIARRRVVEIAQIGERRDEYGRMKRSGDVSGV